MQVVQVPKCTEQPACRAVKVGQSTRGNQGFNPSWFNDVCSLVRACMENFRHLTADLGWHFSYRLRLLVQVSAVRRWMALRFACQGRHCMEASSVRKPKILSRNRVNPVHEASPSS